MKNKENLSIDVCKKLKELGFSIPTRCCYIFDEVESKWVLFRNPFNYDYLPNPFYGGLFSLYPNTEKWIDYVNPVPKADSEDEDFCRDWNDFSGLIVNMFPGMRIDLEFLQNIIIEPEDVGVYDKRGYIVSYYWRKGKDSAFFNSWFDEELFSVISKKGETDRKVFSDDSTKHFLYMREDYEAYCIPSNLCSCPEVQDVIDWFGEKGIHICSSYDQEWTIYLKEHPDTKHTGESYMECLESLIEEAINYYYVFHDD